MTEHALAKRVMKLLKPLDGCRVENRVGMGTPDVNYVHGWIELKQQDHWPKRASTVVKLHHDLTKEQRIWINRREKRGGIVYVLLQVERDYLLFRGSKAASLFGEATQAELRTAALYVWDAKTMNDELLPCLQLGTYPLANDS